MIIPKIIDKNYFFGLNTLRALSFLLVLISHVFFWDGSTISNLNLGAIGVDIFFIISGFLITTIISKEFTTAGVFNIKRFFYRRALRIVPVVLLFCFVLFIVDLFYGLGISLNGYVSGLLFYKHLTNYNLFFQNAHLWSLSVEEQFYIIFPMMLYLFGREIYWKILIVFFIVIPIFNMLHYNAIIPIGLLHNLVAVFANVFGLGMYMLIIGSMGALFLFKNPSIFDFVFKVKNRGFISAVLFFLVILVATPQMNFSYVPNFLYKIFEGISVLMIILINISAERENIFWDNPLLVYLGKLSYSLYVWQQLFTHNQPWGGGIFINLICMLLVSMISYHFVEQKFIRLRKNLGC